MEDLPGGGFADRAGDCDDFEIILSAIPSGEDAEGFDSIINLENDFILEFIEGDVFTDNGAASAFCEDVCEEVMAIEVRACDCEEAVAGVNGSGIGAYS